MWLILATRLCLVSVGQEIQQHVPIGTSSAPHHVHTLQQGARLVLQADIDVCVQALHVAHVFPAVISLMAMIGRVCSLPPSVATLAQGNSSNQFGLRRPPLFCTSVPGF